MSQNLRHILDISVCTRPWLDQLFERVDQLHEGGYEKNLSGKIVATAFFEPSTRTRLSFTAAAYKLGAEVLGFDTAASTSVAKGESLEDTIRMISSYADVIVLRHPEVGAAERAAAVSTVPVINAGDGTGQHPTQSMMDLYTIRHNLKRLDNFSIAFIGNLKYYRAVRSLAMLLADISSNVTMTFVSAPELKLLSDITDYLTAHKVTYTEITDLEKIVRSADVLYQTRMQKEWLTPIEFERLKDHYILTRSVVDTMKAGGIIMHALPRVNEIESAVDESEHSKYFQQAAFGLPVRAALLEYCLGLWS